MTSLFCGTKRLRNSTINSEYISIGFTPVEPDPPTHLQKKKQTKFNEPLTTLEKTKNKNGDPVVDTKTGPFVVIKLCSVFFLGVP